MGLSESIEKILQNNSGQLSLEKVITALGKKYAQQTILDFLQNEKSLISFDGENIILIKYPLQHFIGILEDFIENRGANRKAVFYSGAFYLYYRRQFPGQRSDNDLNFNYIKKNFGAESLDNYELYGRSPSLELPFNLEMNQFFDSGWIDMLDSKEFYSFSQEFYEYFINSFGGGRVLFSTPTTLVQLICKIIPKNRSLKVYNPAAGMLKLLTAIKINSRFEITATASEKNQEIHKVGELFAKTNGFELNFSNQDSLYELDHLESSAFDLIVSIPPFMAKIDNQYERHNADYNDVALVLISSSLSKLQEDGMAIFLVPDGVLFSTSNEFRRFRREIIESKLIHTIVSLPVQLFNPIASVKSSLLIFRKGINHQSVRFIDTSSKKFYSFTRDKFISMEIDKIAELIDEPSQPNRVIEDQGLYGIPETLEFDFQQLKNEGFSLNLNDYFVKYIQPKESGYTELRKFVSQIRLQPNAGIELPYIRITDLNGGVIDEINRFPINHSRTKGKILSEQAFLVGKVGGSSKPSWYNSESPVEISNNIVALKTDHQKVNNEYLLQELNSVYVQKQMEFLSIGTTTLRYLRLEDLLKIKIKLPSLQDQIRISENRSEFIQQQSLTVNSGSGTITDADIFKAINHEIGNILKGPEGFIDLLPDFLISSNISLDKPIVDAKDAISVGEMISMAGKQIKNVYEVMQNMKGILFSEKKYFKTEKTELKKYFREKLQNELIHRDINFYIGIDNNFVNPTSIFGSIDPFQFQYIVRNIVTNAINHSGVSLSQGEYLNLFVNIDLMKNELEIHFMNNGNTFPSDFTLDSYLGFNKKSGNSTGQGLGGYLIGRVVENHSGKIRIQSEKRVIDVLVSGENVSLESNVDIVITIPKVQ
jgi:type I restriction-modification system DNA methylase subunit/signal transduction histidine kinase